MIPWEDNLPEKIRAIRDQFCCGLVDAKKIHKRRALQVMLMDVPDPVLRDILEEILDEVFGPRRS